MFGKLSSFVMVVTLFLISFFVVNTVHFQFLTVRVVLYDALLDAAIAGIFASTICFVFLARCFATTREEMALSLIIGLLLTILYSLSVPAIIDRSLSVYILEKLAQRGGAIRREAMEDILKQEFFPEHRLVDVRLTEQINSGTVTVDKGCVRLTQRGMIIAGLTRFYRRHLLPKKREIMGKYSDDLTDPFRHSSVVVPFECD